MKYIFSLCLLMGWAGIFYAQTVTVLDQTDQPLKGATLITEDTKSSAITNAEGQADISSFKEAERIEIRSLGFKTFIQSFKGLEEAGFVVRLEPYGLELDEVVISASRWSQATRNVPSKITSISLEEVALQNSQTAADLLGISGKVFIQKSQQGGGSPMIRGFATNRLLYTVDGVRMNTAIFRGGNLQNVINLDPFAIENTEVLFGPGSVIYGSDAIGGVMSFRTLTPELSLTKKPAVTGKAVARYSTANNEKTGHFNVNVGWDSWALTTSFSSWNYDHLKQGSNGPEDYIKGVFVQRQDNKDVVLTQDDPLLQIPSAYSQINLMQKVRFQPNENWNIQYGFHYSTTSPYGRYDRHNRFRNGNLRYGEWDYGPQKWMMNHFSVSHHGINPVYDQLSLQLAQQSFEESRINRSLNNNERSTQTEKVEAYSINLDFFKSIGSRNSLFYGFEYVLDDVSSQGILTDILTGFMQTGPSRYPISTWSSAALYLNDEYRVSDKITLQAGVRYNRFKLEGDFINNINFYPFPFTSAELNDGALTGSIGGVFRPAPSWVIKASFGTAFRSPNVDDVGKVFDSEPGAVTVPNPDLKAEYAYNFDFGIAKVFGEIVKVDLTGYYTILNNALVRRDFQINGRDSILYDGVISQVQAIQNAAVANVYGVQAGLEVKLSREFTLLSDLNYQLGEEELDDGSTSRSRHAAPLFGASRLRFQHHDLTLEFNAIYQGEISSADLAREEQAKDEIYAKDNNGNNYAPSWYTLNLKARYRLTETFNLSAGLENLTDQRYRPYSSGISGPGRNFILSLSAAF